MMSGRVKEKPILFSAPMVRALLEGRKTQTRRIVSSANSEVDGSFWNKERFESLNFSATDLAEDISYRSSCGCVKYLASSLDDDPTIGHRVRSRWNVGERLWVRENFTFVNVDRERNLLCIAYNADGESLPTRVDLIVTYPQLADFMGDEREKIDPFKRRRYPAMFMNRWASRITLDVAQIRVERLLDISEEDAIAEGLTAVTKDGTLYKYGIPDSDGLPGTDDHGWPWQEWDVDPRMAYFKLWNKLNGEGAAQLNPWVWAVSFPAVSA